ncbi:MAG: hypothetical protein H6813_00190 [Phycisphaeraceae bacterium]|nr:hypothetical protein [Phycisphaeraceae bacterium]MCB9847495.1 hypothetical protein [Phycisphaeraceae bacterium]
MNRMFTRALISGAVAALAGAAHAATPGFVETFQSGLNGWGSNPSLVTLVTSGGADGAADAYAAVSDTGFSELLIRRSATDGPEFSGNFLAAGITGIAFDVNELGIDDGLSIRVGFGTLGNFWVSNTSIDPQADTWETFSVQLIESNFTEVFGAGGTWNAAMSNVQRFQIRHDADPIGIMPDPSTGDFGVDNIRLIPTPGAGGLLALAGAAALRRRR